MVARISALKVRRRELEAVRLARRAKGLQMNTPRSDKLSAENTAALVAAHDELVRLRSQDTTHTTGHAFIVFTSESTRNGFVQKFSRSHARWWSSGGLLRPLFGFANWSVYGLRDSLRQSSTAEGLPVLEQSAAGGPVTVTVGPEPSDVYWEHLHFDDAYTFLAQARTYAVTFALLVVNGVALSYIQIAIAGNQSARHGASDYLLSGVSSLLIFTLNHFLQV